MLESKFLGSASCVEVMATNSDSSHRSIGSRSLQAAGHDPLQVLADRAHSKGKIR